MKESWEHKWPAKEAGLLTFFKPIQDYSVSDRVYISGWFTNLIFNLSKQEGRHFTIRIPDKPEQMSFVFPESDTDGVSQPSAD